MQGLVIVDAQKEFGPGGRREVENHGEALATIRARLEDARREGRPIAFVRHHNVGPDIDAFVPGSWGAEFSDGLAALPGRPQEIEFVKEVIGAFTTTGLEAWLREHGCDEVLLVGFYAQQCLSTSAREAYVRGFRVAVDPDGTSSRALRHPLLGEQSAAEVKRSALLHLAGIGVEITPRVAPEAVVIA
jgi:nicotinamidase-related amidase